MLTPLMLALALLTAPAGGDAQRAPAKPQKKKPAATKPAPPPPPDVLPEQVMLDRAGFSPGAIDGRPGRNTDKALAEYRAAGGGTPPSGDATVQYTITAEDAAGPYDPALPTDMMQQSKVPALTYRTPLEALAERFHATPQLLQRLNPAARFEANEVIVVPNVAPMVVPVERIKVDPAQRGAAPAARGTTAPAPEKPVKPDVVVTVSKSASALWVKDDGGRVVFYAPVTTGSEHDPLPIGEWKVNGTQFNPTFRYNPALFWDADPAHSKAVIPAGPNNPVGVVWIDLSKDHYGFHGTPEPSAIGRAESHGCVRLTNWDALRLAGFVKPGTRVVFTE